jgi:hypothetical protein
MYIFLNGLFCSGSSTGDLGDITPCNASPNLSALMTFRQVVRDDTEEIWRQQVQNLIIQNPCNPLDVFQLLSKVFRVIIHNY